MIRRRASWELLEPRRLLAYDLAVTDITELSPYTRPGGEIELVILYDNVTPDFDPDPASPHFEGTSRFFYTLTTDRHLGSPDDIAAGFDEGPDMVWHYFDPEEEPTEFEVPANTPPGRYHLAVTIVRVTGGPGAEQNTANNTFITATPEIAVTDAVWPSSTIFGTAGPDRIFIAANDFGLQASDTFISLNDDVRRAPTAQIYIDSGAGNDRIACLGDSVFRDLLITGSGGNDFITTGDGDDSISGGNGHDRILSGFGDDDVLGGAGSDYINTEQGDDLARGAGGNDKLIDAFGADYLIGGAGNDVFDTRDVLPSVFGDEPDSISGNSGADTALVDELDGVSSIEEILRIPLE